MQFTVADGRNRKFCFRCGMTATEVLIGATGLRIAIATHRQACATCCAPPTPPATTAPPRQPAPSRPSGGASPFVRDALPSYNRRPQPTVWDTPPPSTSTPAPTRPAAIPQSTRPAPGPRSTPESREAANCLEATRTIQELAVAANAARDRFLTSSSRPDNLHDDFFPSAIDRVLEPSHLLTAAPVEQSFDWSNTPPLPKPDALVFEEIKAHAVGPAGQLKYGSRGLIQHVINAKAGTVNCVKGLKTHRASRSDAQNKQAESYVKCLHDATTTRAYLELIQARIHQVQGGARKAASILQQAFYFSIWGQHCAHLSLSPFRWIWALGSRMSPEQRASEEGLLISFLAYASIRWQSFAVVAQCMSHIFSYHERYMLVPRLDKHLGILHVWMKDFESRMITEEVSGHRRDALMPAHLGEVISRELLFLQLPTLAQFVAHPRELFDLLPADEADALDGGEPDMGAAASSARIPHGSDRMGAARMPPRDPDTSCSAFRFVRRAAGAVPRQLATEILHSITCAAAMATCSKGCYRGGNIAVGEKFEPSAVTTDTSGTKVEPGPHWTRQQAAAMAGMVHTGHRIALPKPSTKGSASKSKKARKLARMPQAFEHAPDDPLDLPTLFYIMCWLIPVVQSDWASTPVFKGVLATSNASISIDELTAWIRAKLAQHHPCLAKLLHITQYSARIGMATVLALVATPAELDLFGAWASDVGRTVYARMTAERSLQITRATMKVNDVTLESLEATVASASSRHQVVSLPTASGTMPQVTAIRPLYAPAPLEIGETSHDSWSASGDTASGVHDDVLSPATRGAPKRKAILGPGAEPRASRTLPPAQSSRRISDMWKTVE